MATPKLYYAGTPVHQAQKALILVHGRGATAESILSVAPFLAVDDYAWVAPQAPLHTWYPYSFMAPEHQNQPDLDQALHLLRDSVQQLVEQGISSEQIYFFGFSQGACLSLEFVARNAQKYGGVVAVIGGLIGESLNAEKYRGDFQQTPIFLATSDPDVHVPLQRVEDTATLLSQLQADVTLKVYKNAGHTLLQEEVDAANQLIFG
jgi:phospholipase/carboxylesterase